MGHPVHHSFTVYNWETEPPDVLLDEDRLIHVSTDTWYSLQYLEWHWDENGLHFYEEEAWDWEGDEDAIGKAVSEDFSGYMVFLDILSDDDDDVVTWRRYYKDGECLGEWYQEYAEPPVVPPVPAQ